MGYGVYRDIEGYDRWAGYMVPAICDWEGCEEEIDRGLAYKCETHYLEDNEGVEHETHGCGFYFCENHGGRHEEHLDNASAMGDHPKWMAWLLHHPSWEEWRNQTPDKVEAFKLGLQVAGIDSRELYEEQGGDEG